MDDKYMSKLSPTVDFWAGMYLVIIGEYTACLFQCHTVLSVAGILNVLSLHRFILDFIFSEM